MIGIILAGGGATRFEGIPKELLPLDQHKVVIDSQLTAMRFAGIQEVFVVTSPKKIYMHAQRFAHMNYEGMGIYPRLVIPPVSYLESQDFGKTLTWALQELSRGKVTAIGLADTIVPPDAYYPLVVDQSSAGVRLGTFKTTEPERFSILVGNRIITKPQKGFLEGVQNAWGIIVLRENVVEHLSGKQFPHYDAALNEAIKIYDCSEHRLTYYYDIGSYQWYKEYMGRT